MILAENLFEISEASVELFGFVGGFLAAGAVGFRYTSLRSRLTKSATTDEQSMYGAAAARTAFIGLIGTLIGLLMTLNSLPRQAARQHVGVPQLLAHNGQAMVQVALAIAAVVGFGLAAARIGAGWPLAAIGVVGGALRAAFFGQWSRLINPIHRLSAGLWIGTLLVLVVAGLASVARSSLTPEQRGRAAADMVNAFSRLALWSFPFLVFFGINTAWRHLGTLDQLWKTPYGYTLIAKLVAVALVVAFGAFNWRRQKPLLGTEQATGALRRSATGELVLAAIVLVITSILVSLPAPSESKPEPKKPAATPGSMH